VKCIFKITAEDSIEHDRLKSV